MPGVPTEMFAMFEAQVRPRLLAAGLGGGVFVQRKVNTFGAGESMVEEKLLDLTRRGHVPEVGITVSDWVVSLRILARAATAADAAAQIEPVERTIRERLGDLVFGVEDEELQDAVVKLLHERRQTLATAEGVTAGLVAHRIGRVPGASRWFRGGVVAYDNRWKVDHLAVPSDLIAEKGAVSKDVAEAMAVGCRVKYGVDLAVATVGFAGPGGATEGVPVGTAWTALAHAGGVVALPFGWLGTRDEIQSRSAKQALNLVRLHLLRGANPAL